MRRQILALICAPALVLGLAAPALAFGPVIPPSIPTNPDTEYFYDLWFGPTDADWIPQGTVVADSGMRPLPNGFPYANYAGSLKVNQVFWGTPDNELQPMTSEYMIDLFGEGVCAGPVNSDGSCEMTPAAEYQAVAIMDSVDGVGHCVGFAITAAALFNGEIEPEAVSATSLASQSVLTPDTQNLIARNWATQYYTPMTDLTPAQVVGQLIEDFSTPGQVPHILRIWWQSETGQEEGHGITPYAVYDRGNGLFDIAVYDNNYPFKERAIHVDTVANTWEYQVLINPNAPATIASGNATTKNTQLQSVADSLEQQECVVCKGGRNTNLVVMNPIPAATLQGLSVALLDGEGQGLPPERYSVLLPVDSGNPDLVGVRGIDVAPGDGFQYALATSDSSPDFPLTITNLSVNGVKKVSVPNFPGGAAARAEFDAAGVFGFGGSVALKPKMERVFSEGARHYTSIVYGGQAVAADNGRTITVKTAKEAVYYGDANAAGGAMTVTVGLDRGTDARKFRATNVTYPEGGQLMLDYSGWKRTTQRPVFGVDTDGNGTIDIPVKMKRIGR
jgi:hypothetical protein